MRSCPNTLPRDSTFIALFLCQFTCDSLSHCTFLYTFKWGSRQRHSDRGTTVTREAAVITPIAKDRIISFAVMGLAKKAYPKATLKKIIKAHSNHNLKKNADVTVGTSCAYATRRWLC